MTRISNFCAAILAVASACRTAIKDAARIIFGFFAAEANAAVGFLPTIRRMKSATAFLAVAVAIPLMSACGGGGSGISATPPTPRIVPADPPIVPADPPIVPADTQAEIIALVEADPTNADGDITQPEASSTGADFTTAAGTDEDLIFPVDSALIRTASGNGYVYIYQQAAFNFTVTTTVTTITPEIPGTPATSYEFTAASFVVDASAGGTGCSQIGGFSGSGSFGCSGGVWTFTGWTGIIQAGALFNGLQFSTLASGTSPSAGSRTPRGGSTTTPSTTTAVTTTVTTTTPTTVTTAISAAVHDVWEFDTEGTNTTVAAVVSRLQTLVDGSRVSTGLETASVAIAVKGARDTVTYLDRTTGENASRVVEAYLFEAQYSALAGWIEDPDNFLSRGSSSGSWATEFDPIPRIPRVLYFGLQTPAAAADARTGTAIYSGIAAGQYLEEGGATVDDRFLVGGVVTLNVDFTTNEGITGRANLAAYNVGDLAALDGVVTVDLTNPDRSTRSNIDDAIFSGRVTIVGMPIDDTAFDDLNGLAGTFDGYFTGPGAEEAVGRVIVVTGSGTPATTDDAILEFGFLTREE